VALLAIKKILNVTYNSQGVQHFQTAQAAYTANVSTPRTDQMGGRLMAKGMYTELQSNKLHHYTNPEQLPKLGKWLMCPASYTVDQ
jgi:hypothetical protein